MNKKKSLSMWVVALLLLCLPTACNKEYTQPIDGATFCKTSVTSYVVPDTIFFSKKRITEDSAMIVDCRYGHFISERKTFDSLCNSVGDLAYNTYSIGPRMALLDSILEARVVALDDFSADYPAGSDISDAVELQYASYYDFIRQGYKCDDDSLFKDDKEKANYYQDMMDLYGMEGINLYKKTLSTLTRSDTRLVVPKFALRFIKRPMAKGRHRFRITLVLNHARLDREFDYWF